MVESARRLSARAAREAGDGGDAAFVVQLWRAALSRNPTADEEAAAAQWLTAETEGDTGEFDRHARLAQAVLATAEFQVID